MAHNEDQLRSSLTLAVEIILSSHYHSVAMKNSESAWFVETHKEVLDNSLNTILMQMIDALFLDSLDYGQCLNLLEREGVEQGIYTAEIFADHFDNLLEMSKDLNLTAQTMMISIIEEAIEDSAYRLFLINRVMECNWTRFSGFARGYLSNKNQQIHSLHEQKIAVMGQMAAGMAHEAQTS